MLESTRPQSLREQTLRTLREVWHPLAPHARNYRVAAETVDDLARQTLDAMITRPFRVGVLPVDEEYAQLLARVRHWVARGKPVSITVGYAPMKNPKADSRAADWAEFFALGHLAEWHNKVAAVYPPGLRLRIIFDDSTIAMANRGDRGLMKQYMRSVARLVPAMGYQALIVRIMRQSWFAWLFHFGLYQWAERRVRQWEADPVHREVREKMREFAERNLTLPAELTAAEQSAAWERAAHRYRVYWQALQSSGFSRLGHSIIAMYLDGSQHHIRQAAALHLTSVGKGQVTQPWQGSGALMDNGKRALVPIVLTAGRRARMTIEEVDQLDLLPVAGFEKILVAREGVKESGDNKETRAV